MKSVTVKLGLALSLILAGVGLSACHDDHPGSWGSHHPSDRDHGDHGDHGDHHD